MACMEHDCRDCGHMWFNNEPGGACPECNSINVAHFHDEQDDDDIVIESEDTDDWDDEDDEDDDDSEWWEDELDDGGEISEDD